MYIRSRAPLRISFSGGGTDVPPYPEERGGCVLSATIDKFCYSTIAPKEDRSIRLQSLDYDIVAKYRAEERLPYDGQLDLIKAAFNVMGISDGLELFIHSDAPPGTGLGSSSTLVVSLVGAIAAWKGLELSQYEIADLAYRIEREELKIVGGLQDQFAATFGGFNFIEFHKDQTVVHPLRIKKEILHELRYNLLLCYTGVIRLSGGIVEQQRRSYVAGLPSVVEALDHVKSLTLELKNALLLNRLGDFGALLHEAWEHKKKLDPNITNSRIDALYDAARSQGAIGGKILGAGGGGYLLLYVPFQRKHLIARDLERLGGQVVDFDFEFRGLQSWRVR